MLSHKEHIYRSKDRSIRTADACRSRHRDRSEGREDNIMGKPPVQFLLQQREPDGKCHLRHPQGIRRRRTHRTAYRICQDHRTPQTHRDGISCQIRQHTQGDGRGPLGIEKRRQRTPQKRLPSQFRQRQQNGSVTRDRQTVPQIRERRMIHKQSLYALKPAGYGDVEAHTGIITNMKCWLVYLEIHG